jgi:hypothetical protein
VVVPPVVDVFVVAAFVDDAGFASATAEMAPAATRNAPAVAISAPLFLNVIDLLLGGYRTHAGGRT